jgi:LacI family transcriptional regulator
MLNGINDCLERHVLHLLISNVPDNMPDKVAELPKILRSLLADGMLVNYNQHLSADMVSFIERSNVPTVWVNIKREENCVFPNNFGASAQATQKMIDCGHKRICYIDYLIEDEAKPDHFSIQDRADGYLQTMKNAGLDPVVYTSSDFNDFAKLMSRPDRPTALLVYWCGLLTYIVPVIKSLGLTVPQDVSMMTFASQSSAFHGLFVNAVVEPDHEMGEMATEMLLKRIKVSKNLPPSSIDFTFLDSGTVIPPR